MPRAGAKLVALADFAERYEHKFLRVESVAKLTDGRLRLLNLRESKVREVVRAFGHGKVTPLYESATAKDFV